jgi:hypothetical protein
MSVDLATPSNTLVKVRWKEPYVSEGLNKKLNGLVPSGVIRGGLLTTSLLNSRVTIAADPDTGDSVYSFIDANGHQLTFRQNGDVVLDLDVGALPGTTVYVGLEVVYVTSAATTVKWIGYDYTEVDGDDSLVVLGSAIVPGAPALIPLADITYDRRRTAWQNISRFMREADQVIKNGDFELADETLPGAADDNRWPWWDYTRATETGLAFQVLQTGTPQIGNRHLSLAMTGVATQVGVLPHEGFYQVRGGELVKVKYWIKGDAGLVAGPTHMGVKVLVSEENPDSGIQTEYVEDLALADPLGFVYTEIERVFRIDDDARWIRLEVYFDDNSHSSTGAIYVDDVRMWIEQPQTDDGSVEGYGALHEGAVLARSLDIVKPPGIAADLIEFIENILTLRWDSGQIYDMKRRPNAVQDFILRLVNGGLNIGNLIESLGANQINSDVNAAKARVTTPFPLHSAGKYTLLWEMANQAAGQASVRFYVTDQSDIPGRTADTFSIIWNAVWSGSTLNWTYDASGSRAMRLDFTKEGIYLLVKDPSGAVDPWIDAEWEDNVESFEYFSTVRTAPGTGATGVLGQLSVSNLATQLGAELAKIQGNIIDSTTNSYTLIAEFESDVASRRLARIYLNIGTGSVSFYVTTNARWDDTTGSGQWEVDVAGMDAYAVYFSGSITGLQVRTHSQADGDTWTTWDQLWMCNPDATNKDVEVDLRDGTIQMTSTTTKSNPVWNDGTVDANTLYAKNIVKAWAHVDITGTSGSRIVTVADGFGWDSITLVGSGRLELDLDQALGVGYAAVLTNLVGTSTTMWSNYITGAGILDIGAINATTGVVIDIDADSNAYSVSVVVLGQNS